MDCVESCPLPDKIPEIQESLKVAGIDVNTTILSAIFFCFIMLIFVGYVYFKGSFFD